ncbi:MAG: DUF2231 domain-containing protein [Alphaproteobacteria bacterium]|nr:DUF2231 domain-containing protein [Alphaproteobacteria bacterium]
MIEVLPNWHPILVHFTLALFTVAALLFWAGAFLRQRAWAANLTTTAFWNLWIGAGLTVATVAAGFYAFNTVKHDAASHAAMTDHRNWALATAGVWWGLALWSGWIGRKGERPPALFHLALVPALLLLLTTGWKGGELVYRHGMGVMPPKAASEPVPAGPEHGDGHHHDHDH